MSYYEKMIGGHLMTNDTVTNVQRLMKWGLLLIVFQYSKNINVGSTSAFVLRYDVPSTVSPTSSSSQMNLFDPYLCNKNLRHNPTLMLYRNTYTRNWFLCNSISNQEHSNDMSVGNNLDTIDLFNADIKRIVDRTTRNAPGYYNPVDAAKRAHAMLHHMLKSYQRSGGKTAAKPNRESFRLVLQGYVNLGSTTWVSSESNYNNNGATKESMINGAYRVEQLFNEMIDFFGEEALIADIEIINLVLKSYALCSSRTSLDINDNNDHNQANDNPYPLSFAQKADIILEKYVVVNSSTNDIKLLKQYGQSYAYAIEAWSHHHHRQVYNNKKNRNNNLGEDQEELSLKNNLDKTTSASIIHVTSLLDQLQNIYQLMNKINIESNSTNKKEIVFLQRLLVWAYSNIIEAWCNFDRSFNSAKNAETILKQMEQITNVDQFLSDNTAALKETGKIMSSEKDMFLPGVREYNIVIVAFSQIHSDESTKNHRNYYQMKASSKSTSSAAQHADDLLKKMLKLYDTGRWGSQNKPGALAFNAVITAWSNNAIRSSRSAAMAEKVLNSFENLYLDQSKPQYDFAPDNVSYNAAITAWANCREDGSVYKAEELYQQMIKNSKKYHENKLEPDAYTYNAITNAWIRSRLGVTSAEKAEEYLNIMENSYFEDGRKDLKPNVKNYSAVINAWAKSGAEDGLGAHRALKLLDHMETLYDNEVADDDYIHNQNLDKFDIRSSHSYSRNKLKNKDGYDGPDAIIYTSVIDAFAQSRLPEAADIALQLLDRLEDRVDRHRNQLLHSGKGETDTNKELYSMMPNVRTYTSVILALANTRQDGNIIKAQNILNRMKTVYSQTGNENVLPNIFTHNYIINCAANTVGSQEKEGIIDNSKREAFKIAMSSFQELRKEKNANSFTYAFFIKACVNLLPSSSVQTKIIEQAFLECCKDGQVTDQVIKRVVRGVPQSKASELFAAITTERTKRLRKALKDIKAVDLDPNVTRNNRIQR